MSEEERRRGGVVGSQGARRRWSDPARQPEWDFEANDEASHVLRAFDRYHAWAGEDAVGLEFLLDRVGEVEQLGERNRRRDELLEAAVEEGHVSREVAEEAYEIAGEEGIEPAFALELVRAGVAIERPGEPEADVPAVQPTQPEWIEDPPPPEAAHRERVMRETFRRLRSLFERYPDPKDAFRALASADDFRRFEY